MKNNSYADEITATKLMLAGLKANVEQLKKRGIDEQFITELESEYNEMLTLDNEQEALKSRLKEKTAALDGKIVSVQKRRSEARKIVKMGMTQQSWKEFGIEDIR